MGRPISVGASQLLLPFLEKLVASPKGEQTWRVMEAMRQATMPATPKAEPFQRFIGNLTRSELAPGLTARPANIRHGRPSNVMFEMGVPGERPPLRGSLSAGNAPDEAYIDSLASQTTRRREIGSAGSGMENYAMDISSPAQRELPFRQRLAPQAKAARPMREPEERLPWTPQGASSMPMPSLAQKQQMIDALFATMRQSGIKKVSYAAEPGERPRYYEKLTGYKSQPQGETSIEDLLAGFSGRARRPQQGAATPPTVANPRQQLLQQGTTLTPQSIEMLTGMGIDEALEYGMARRMGQSSLYQLTDEGRRSAAQWGVE